MKLQVHAHASHISLDIDHAYLNRPQSFVITGKSFVLKLHDQSYIMILCKYSDLVMPRDFNQAIRNTRAREVSEPTRLARLTVLGKQPGYKVFMI